MAKTKSYEVEMAHTTGSGAKKTMWRAGRQFEVKVPQLLDLTPEEVEAFEDDKRFSIKEASELTSSTDSSDEASDSEEDSSTGDDTASEEDDSTEDSDSEDSSSDEAEEVSDDSTEAEAPTVDSLVKDNSRNELNALALEAGVEAPEALETKTEVAQAIVDAQASNSESEATS